MNELHTPTRDEQQRNTYQAVLDTALTLMQRCGYHAFSYADIAKSVGIRKASIHYYFPNKSDLARSVIARYRASAHAGLEQLQHTVPEPEQQLERYMTFLGEFEGEPRMCLCALLAGEMLTLPDDVRAEVKAYYQEQETWLSTILEAGRDAGTLRYDGTSSVAAQTLLAGLEGAMLAARAYGDVARFHTISGHLLKQYQKAA